MRYGLKELSLASLIIVPLSGIIPIRGTDIWYVQYVWLFSFYLFFISCFFFKFNWRYALFSLVCLFSTVVVAQQHPRAIFCLYQVYFSIGAIWWISLQDHDFRKKAVGTILILFAIQVFWVILQSFNLDPIFNKVGDRSLDDTVAFSGSHNQMGLFFASTISYVLIYLPVAIPLSILSIYQSTTTIAWVSAFSTMFFISYIQGARVGIVIFFIAVLATSFIFFKYKELMNIDVMTERWRLIVHTVKAVNSGKIVVETPSLQVKKVIQANPIFGYGLGNFMRISPKAQYQFLNIDKDKNSLVQHRYEHVHNDIVEVLFDLGYVGLFSVLFIILDLVFKFIYARKTKLMVTAFASVFAHFICSMGIYTVHTAVSGLMLIFSLGIFYGEVGDGSSASMGKGAA